MRKSKVASMDSGMAKTPKESMAPAQPDKNALEEKLRMGEMDLEHLMKAHDIQNDPEKMEYVHKAHGKKMGAMRSIADLKTAAQALAAQQKEEIAEPKMSKNKELRMQNAEAKSLGVEKMRKKNSF
jgi:hypothetical protein